LSEDTKLSQGQTIWVSYEVSKEMNLSEARELIRTNAPSNFQTKEVSATPFEASSAH
jgi:hypothetical protein